MPDTVHLLGEHTQHSSKKTTIYFTDIFLVYMAMNSNCIVILFHQQTRAAYYSKCWPYIIS